MKVSIDEILNRGVEKIYPSREALKKVLRSDKKLRLYQGFDPTGTKLHIGHAVALNKLRQFQELGHQVIFLIGDGTGQAGDPSGRETARDRFLSREELRQNARDYVKQAGKIVRFDGPNPVKILYNGDWLNKLSYADILKLAQHFSVQQLIERDIFRRRMKRGQTINLREFLYPLFQAYDSVAMKVDLELGGIDQTFNMLAGRMLVRNILKKEKFVMTVPLLTDATGKKIGKSEGNVIGITDSPNDLYGKIMNLPDEAIALCFELITSLSMDEVEKIRKNLKKPHVNPMDFKKKLARTLVSIYHSPHEAKKAEENFERVFQKKQKPLQIPDYVLADSKPLPLIDLLIDSGLAKSKSEAKRLIKQQAVDIDGYPVEDVNRSIFPREGLVVRVGKRKFVRIRVVK